MLMAASRPGVLSANKKKSAGTGGFPVPALQMSIYKTSANRRQDGDKK